MASRQDFIIARPTTGNSVTFMGFSATFTFARVFSKQSAWSPQSTARVQLQHMRSHAWRFGNPKAGTSPIHSDAFFLSLHFCGIWWSLRIMFPTLGLFFIEFNLHLCKREKKTWRLRSALEFCFFFAIRFCAYKRWPQAYIKCSLFIHKTSVHAARNCRHLTLSSSLLFLLPPREIKKLRYIYSLAVVSFFFGFTWRMITCIYGIWLRFCFAI